MTYSHRTNHSYTPPIDFWRPLEKLFNSFPYWIQWNKYRSKDDFISFYEMETNESFDVYDDDVDIYSNFITDLDDKINYTGKIIKFLSNHISNSESVHKFQLFFEIAYEYLVNIQNLDINNPIIRSHGLGNINDSNYERMKGIFINDYINNDRGIIKPEILKDYFNTSCRRHDVPFVMFTQNNECYVIHTTDSFVEKEILDMPVFLRNNGFGEANVYFIKAIKHRNQMNFAECLNTLRKSIEEIRNKIYDKYGLSINRVLFNDLRDLFETHNVLDFSKIPESNSDELEKITTRLKETVLLTVKITNLGSHAISSSITIEESLVIVSLGLVASIFPYIISLLR